MTAEKRNARVVVALIGSMTLGAAALLLLEPRPADGNDRAPLLMAENEQPVQQITFYYSPTRQNVADAAFDLVIESGCAPRWNNYRATDLHVVVLGVGGDQLATDVKATVLELLRQLHAQRGLNLRHVRLNRSADARANRFLPGEAHELTQLLELRGFLR